MIEEILEPQEPSSGVPTDEPIYPEEHEEELPQRAPRTARTVAVFGARMVTGLIAVGAMIVTIGAASLLPLPTIRSAPVASVVVPVPTAQQLVCPGALLRLSNDTGQSATTSSALGLPDVRSFSSTGRLQSTPLKISDAGTGGGPSAPLVLSTPPNPANPTERLVLSGAQAQTVNAGEFSGLAAADCGAASGDLWLAGGSTVVGRTTLLTLSNPTEVPAAVDLQLFGGTGRIIAPGTGGIVVAPGAQRVISLAGFAPDVAALVVHVTSTGGQIVATLQESIVRGLDPGGVDLMGATTPPGKVTVIPGLSVAGVAAVQVLQGGGPAFDDTRTVLRLFAPGTGTVVTTISVIPEDGKSKGTSLQWNLEAGRVIDVPIGDLTDGNYAITVTAASPVLATARVTSAQTAAPGSAATTDVAWLAASAELKGTAQFTVAPGPSPVLHLVNPTLADAVVQLKPVNGAPVQLTVPAGAATLYAVSPGETYTMTGFDRLYASVVLSGGGGIAHYTVHPQAAGSTPVTVYR